MKISAVATRVEHFELIRPYRIAFRSVDAVENVIVAIHTERGLVGTGAASAEPHVTGETPEACREALTESNLDWMLGRDIRELPALCRELARRLRHTPAARAALDMAAHDLLARHLGLPLVDMLGRCHDRLPTSITIGIKPSDETVTEAREYLDRGFTVLKVKLGASLEEDLDRLAALRREIGGKPLIRVDPNQGYNAAQVERFFRETADLGIEFVEQPMPVSASMRDLPTAMRARLAADESLLTPGDAFALASPPAACGIFNIKLMKCGGIRPALDIATIAESAGIDLMWGCMDESTISISAALHAALACPRTRYLDLDGSLDLARDVVVGGFLLEDGELRTTNAPGLGVAGL